VRAPTTHLVLGVSLGGHAAWHTLLHDPRVAAGVVVIGCPDFARLMAHRASRSRLAAWQGEEGGDGRAGARFFGSTAFPDSMIAALDGADPAATLLPPGARAPALAPLQVPADGALVPPRKQHLVIRLRRTLGGKAVLNLAGAKDKLVPYACSEPFLRFLKIANEPGKGWWGEGSLHLEDKVFENAGHELTPDMVREAVRFIGDVLEGKVRVGKGGSKSKM
jgi:pimeloyl-ACP methyl ester carboxylesterase